MNSSHLRNKLQHIFIAIGERDGGVQWLVKFLVVKAYCYRWSGWENHVFLDREALVGGNSYR